jgi:hypothetical protein
MEAGRALRASRAWILHAGFQRSAKTPDIISIVKLKSPLHENGG